jgi:hypothetical protein
VGRKPLAGDVLELPHLKDEYALNEFDTALPRYFVIEDVGRAAEGFSVTWWPHLYRLKLKKIADSQQYADILNRPSDEDANFTGEYDPNRTYNPGEIVKYQGILYTVTATTTGNVPPNTSYYSVYNGNTIQDILSTYNKSLEINDAIVNQAEAETPLSGYATEQFYTLAVDETTGRPALKTVDETEPDASMTGLDVSRIHERPKRSGYTGYLLGDGIPENGVDFGHGIAFPANAVDGDYFLRTDFMPNRLFKFNGTTWVKREDAVRHTLTNTDTRNTQKTGFINNTNTTTVAGDEIAERQSLSKALKPRADL